MKTIHAYEALDGSVHKTKCECAAASIAYIARMENRDKRGTSLGGDAIAFLIDNRKKIGGILREIDTADCESEVTTYPIPGR